MRLWAQCAGISSYFVALKIITMPYNVMDIEGIGPTYAEKLNVQGVKTTTDLLINCGTKRGREKIAAATNNQ